MKDKSEQKNFDRMVRDILKVPYREIKAKLDAEKKAKMAKRKSQQKEK